MTECSRCGDCCERIWDGWQNDGQVERLRRYYGKADPRIDAEWERWRANGFTNRPAETQYWLDANFILDHWHRTEDGEAYTCDKFDPVARLCTAYDDRPPVCRGYPYYEDPLPTDARTQNLPVRCSFRADSPTLQLWDVVPVPVEIGRKVA